MKKGYFILLAFTLSFFISTGMYSFNNLRDHDYEIMSDDEEWDEVMIKILSGSNRPKNSSVTILSLFKPIRVQQNSSTLKVNIDLQEKVNIKITDNTGSPVYLRQFTPGSTNEVLISTSSWIYGDYNITFTNSSGDIIATGEFCVH